MVTEEHAGCEARDIEHGDLRLLEAVVGVQLVDVGPLQPVPQQRREVDQVETALETETRKKNIFITPIPSIFLNF